MAKFRHWENHKTRSSPKVSWISWIPSGFSAFPLVSEQNQVAFWEIWLILENAPLFLFYFKALKLFPIWRSTQAYTHLAEFTDFGRCLYNKQFNCFAGLEPKSGSVSCREPGLVLAGFLSRTRSQSILLPPWFGLKLQLCLLKKKRVVEPSGLFSEIVSCYLSKVDVQNGG